MTYCSVVAALALVGLTKKRFGHYALFKLFPSGQQDGVLDMQKCFDTQEESLETRKEAACF